MRVATFNRRQFLSSASLAGLGALVLPEHPQAHDSVDEKVGDIVVQTEEGLVYASVKESLITGDLLYDGHASMFGQPEIHPVRLVALRGLLQTTVIEYREAEPPYVYLGEDGAYSLELTRHQEDKSFFWGRLQDLGSPRTFKFLYRDFQPFPVVWVILGAAVVICAGLTLFEEFTENCIPQAARTCGDQGVKEVKLVRVFGLRKEGGWHVGCTTDCQIKCNPPS